MHARQTLTFAVAAMAIAALGYEIDLREPDDGTRALAAKVRPDVMLVCYIYRSGGLRSATGRSTTAVSRRRSRAARPGEESGGDAD